MTTRAEFIARVRSGLGNVSSTATPKDHPPGVDERLMRLTRKDEDLATLFAARAAASGMVVHRATLSSLTRTLDSIASTLAPGPVVVDYLPPAFTRAAADVFSQRSTRLINPREAKSLDPQFDAAAGITGVFAAIAETGTLVVVSGDRYSRGAFIVPPVHVAIVNESQLIADMLDLWPLVGDRPPTALTLISGPSKTADIEGILVTGVHGPRAVHVILLAGDP